MSQPGRISRPSSSCRPRTANTPKRLPSAAAAAGGGDAAPISLDDELQTVLRKEYDDGEHGKMEAISDVKAVLEQVAQDPMAQQMDKLLPRFLAPPKSAGSSGVVMEELSCLAKAHPTRSKSKPRAAAPPRHAKLTARPYTASGKSGHSKATATEERPSVPNISREQNDEPPRRFDDNVMRITSAPTIPETRYSTAACSSASSLAPAHPSSSSKRKSRSGRTLDFTITAAEDRDKEDVEHQIPADGQSPLSRTTCSTAGGSEMVLLAAAQQQQQTDDDDDAAHGKAQGDVPFTENLLEFTSDTEDTEEIWKSDIVELTRIKSAPKGKSNSGPASLELKYKEPIWPHQLFLNQILGRHPSLTHLVLDGSELRFFRDLGSSLQSLITLSVCDCRLRSLDGIYGMPNLRTLIARKNMISIPTQLSFLRKLCYLDLSSNPIASADEFGSLRHCGELRILKVYDTPLAINQSNFNKKIKRLVPQLKEIHPSRLYDLFGMPSLMVRSRAGGGGSQQISFMNTVEEEGEEDHQKPGQKQMRRESKQTRSPTTTPTTAAASAATVMMAEGKRNKNINKTTKRKSGKGNVASSCSSSVMPSLAYNDVMVDQPKPGIAYQQLATSKTLREQEKEHRQKQSEIKDVSLGTGDFSGIFMAPKFLQHLQQAMPPSTAEGNNADDDDDDDDDYNNQAEGSKEQEEEEHQKRQKSQQYDDHRYPRRRRPQHEEAIGGAGDAVTANLHHQAEILYQHEASSSAEEEMFGNDDDDGGNVSRKKSDRGIQQQDHHHRRRRQQQQQQQQQQHSSSKNHPRGDGNSECY